MSESWIVRLAAPAVADFKHILKYTIRIYGSQQALLYETNLKQALNSLQKGPCIIGSVVRDNLRRGLRSIHVARRGQRGRHVIFYRMTNEQKVEVLRILYDGMDFARHIPPEDD